MNNKFVVLVQPYWLLSVTYNIKTHSKVN